jgi:predicted DNA-binding transcriptional regulator AlpA
MMPLEGNDTAILPPRTSNKALTECEAAARLGLKVATLRAWRHQHRGPAFVRLGRAIRHLASDLDEFVDANRHRPLSHDQQ